MAAVNNTGNINQIFPQNMQDVTSGKKAQAAADENGFKANTADTVQISNQAKTVDRAVKTAKELPEVRADLVEKAKQQRIAENVRVPAYELAAKMLFEDTIK